MKVIAAVGVVMDSKVLDRSPRHLKLSTRSISFPCLIWGKLPF